MCLIRFHKAGGGNSAPWMNLFLELVTHACNWYNFDFFFFFFFLVCWFNFFCQSLGRLYPSYTMCFARSRKSKKSVHIPSDWIEQAVQQQQHHQQQQQEAKKTEPAEKKQKFDVVATQPVVVAAVPEKKKNKKKAEQSKRNRNEEKASALAKEIQDELAVTRSALKKVRQTDLFFFFFSFD